MKRSTEPTEHVLIKASSNSEWDPVDFAIIHLTDLCKADMLQRLLAVDPFKEDNSFDCLTYWDQPSGYYCNPQHTSLTDKILRDDENWTFITLNATEEETFAVPENQLEVHQFCLTKNGYANFKAYSKHTGEEYWTESFSVNQLLMTPLTQLLDSS